MGITIIVVALLVIAIVLFIWNIYSFRLKDNQDKQYYELNSKLNYITATGSVFILLAAYLGYTNEQNLNSNNDRKIKEFFNENSSVLQKENERLVTRFIGEKSRKIDSLIDSKDILKAGVYIVNDCEFAEGKEYNFKDLRTIDGKELPKFSFAPKLIINTSTGENLRIKAVTNTYFVLGRPITKELYLITDGANPGYPKKVKFDVWIADYKAN